RLIRTIGPTLDTVRNTLYMRELFRLMAEIAGNERVCNRIRFMLQDLAELRKSKWVPRRKEEQAKALDDIHKEA
ncbi:unnamed protein product, partial [Hapterophycus canaliculatus]